MTEALTRTVSGLANQHLFFDVDLVVYCEGGADLLLSDALRDGSEETADAAFWRTIFESIRPGLRVHVKSVGSKSIAREIATLVSDTSVPTVLVCTDADFDDIGPTLQPLSRQVRTWGYSWETDLAHIDILKCVFFRIRPSTQRSRAAFQALDQWYVDFTSKCSEYVLADAQRIKGGSSGVFDRDNPIRCIGGSIGSVPILDDTHLLDRAQAPLADGHAEIVIDPKEVKTPRNCYGKMLLRSCYHALTHFMQRVRRGRLDYDTFVDLAIGCLGQTMAANDERVAYYDSALTVGT